MRLIALITARYNWSSDEVTIGQREMAALWRVDERTAKRETRRLIEAGLIEVKRPGIRGRVAAYRVKRDAIYARTAEEWIGVGPDFDARMSARLTPAAAPEPAKVVHLNFPKQNLPNPKNDCWDKVLARLSIDQPQHFDAWYSQLWADTPDDSGILRIEAPTKFIANYVSSRLMAGLERAVQIAYGQALRCQIEASTSSSKPKKDIVSHEEKMSL